MNQERDAFKAGLFVLAGAGLLLAVVVTLADVGRFFEPDQRARVFYMLRDGVGGLRPGAQVTIGDQPVGRVLAIDDLADPDAPNRVIAKLVTFQIPARYQLGWDAQVAVRSPAIGKGGRLNISSVGAAGPYDPEAMIPGDVLAAMPISDVMRRVVPKGVIPGTRAGSALMRDMLAEAGLGDLQRRQVRGIIAGVHDLLGEQERSVPVATLLAEVEALIPTLEAILDEGSTVMADIKAISASLSDRSEGWFENLDRITGSGAEMLADLRSLVSEQKPVLSAAIRDVGQITERARTRTLPKLNEAMDRATEALTAAHEALAAARGVVIEHRPQIRRMFANLQLTAAQLKLASIEIRRSPWRLLYRPGDEEVAHDNLYDAARSFAQAAGVLQSTAASLRAVVEDPSHDGALASEVLDHLQRVFGKFRQTEAAFWEALQHSTGAEPR